jgi:CBS domain containing-hemolysin-like protein
VQPLPNGEATISGLVSIDEMNERFDLGIEDPIYNTIGGYVFGQLGRRPEIGDEIVANGDILRVEELDGLRIDRIHLIPGPVEEREEFDAADADNAP